MAKFSPEEEKQVTQPMKWIVMSSTGVMFELPGKLALQYIQDENYFGYRQDVANNVMFNPETHGAPKSRFFSEDASEYHRANINNFPKFKKYMDDFLNVAAYEHTKFEEVVRAKSQHLLDLSQFDIEEPIKETKTTNFQFEQPCEGLKPSQG